MEYDIIIIGTTIDRITAAIYALKLEKKVLLIESDKLKDYVLSLENVMNYSLKKYIELNSFKEQIIDYGGTIKYEEIIEIKNNEVITDKEIYKTKTIIIATGARHKLFGITNEEKYFGNGIHFCIKCDAPFYKDEIGCVVGGNNYALENALKLSEICKEVIIIEEKKEFSADNELIEDVLNKNNIKIYCGTKINNLIGDRKLRKILLDNNKEIIVDCIFVSIGFVPNIDLLNIKNNENNIFLVDKFEDKINNEDGISIAKKVISYIDKLK